MNKLILVFIFVLTACTIPMDREQSSDNRIVELPDKGIKPEIMDMTIHDLKETQNQLKNQTVANEVSKLVGKLEIIRNGYYTDEVSITDQQMDRLYQQADYITELAVSRIYTKLSPYSEKTREVETILKKVMSRRNELMEHPQNFDEKLLFLKQMVKAMVQSI